MSMIRCPTILLLISTVIPLSIFSAATSTAFVSLQTIRRRCSTYYACSDNDLTTNNQQQPPLPIGYSSIDGTDPDRPEKVNQDAHFVARIPYDDDDDDVETNSPHWLTILGVMDGHGPKGHVLTAYLKEQLPFRMRQYFRERTSSTTTINDLIKETCGNHIPHDNLEEQDPIIKILIRSFLQSHLDACRNTRIPANRSGTTCIVCVMDELKRTIITAFVGDSHAIMGSWNVDDETQTTTTLEFQRALSNATTVTLPEERRRIERAEEGRIDASGNVWFGPVGIAMTRVLGDSVMIRAGVIPFPDVCVCRGVSKEAVVVVLGTDGLFDVLNYQEIMDVIAAASSSSHKGSEGLQDAAEALTTKAREKWLDGLPMDVKVDDITCVLAKF